MLRPVSHALNSVGLILGTARDFKGLRSKGEG